GYLYGFSLTKTLIITIFANLVPIPFILLFIKQIFKFMEKHNILTSVISKLKNRAMGKSHRIETLEFWGLMFYVGIPLPGTGAWTGALIASLLNIEFKKAMISIFCGILMAAVIMSLGVYGVFHFVF
ncbi:MAG: small multi-drug export protein, partial [Erysipelothrix sp.]|nr:small multi-drug export protein [Erysipelothrix sp.]